MKALFKYWISPFLLSFVIFFFVRPILAQQIELPTSLKDHLQSGSVEVGTEVVSGFQQVFYVYEGNKVFITDSGVNHRHPYSIGEYVTYVGDINEVGQIFLHHIPTQSVMQLTNLGINQRPKVSREGKVVWEGWVEGKWQVFLYDKESVRQITQGDLATNPDVEGEYVTMARRDLTDTWRAEVYSMLEDRSVDVTTGIGTKRPKLTGGKILLLNDNGNSDDFSLTAQDLFTLGLDPLVLSQPQTVSEDEILEELLRDLEATESAELNLESDSQVQEATNSSDILP